MTTTPRVSPDSARIILDSLASGTFDRHDELSTVEVANLRAFCQQVLTDAGEPVLRDDPSALAFTATVLEDAIVDADARHLDDVAFYAAQVHIARSGETIMVLSYDGEGGPWQRADFTAEPPPPPDDLTYSPRQAARALVRPGPGWIIRDGTITDSERNGGPAIEIIAPDGARFVAIVEHDEDPSR